MKKEEIIENLIKGSMESSGNIIKNDMNNTGFSIQTETVPCVDLRKLAKFLAKYVAKEDLIEE
jgi:hypothetical protein